LPNCPSSDSRAVDSVGVLAAGGLGERPEMGRLGAGVVADSICRAVVKASK
jgi:hypothetical protein